MFNNGSNSVGTTSVGDEKVYSLDHPTSPLHDPEAFVREVGQFVRAIVPEGAKVALPVSGGLKSAVAAEILKAVLADNLTLIHVDHGFMRLIEGEEESQIVENMYYDHPNFIYRSDTRDRFYSAVRGIEDAQQKRRAFFEVFNTILGEEMRLSDCDWIIDVTLQHQAKKAREADFAHDARLGIPQKRLRPLVSLSQHQLRVLSRHLSLPYLKQPFPAPGLLIRTIGAYHPEKLEIEKQVNDIVEQEYRGFMVEHMGKDMLIDEASGLLMPYQHFAATLDCKMSKLKMLDVPGLRAVRGSYLESKVTNIAGEGEAICQVYERPFAVLSGGPFYACPYYMDKESVLRLAKHADTSRVMYRIRQSEAGDYSVVIRAVNSADISRAMPNFSGVVPEHAAIRILENVPKVRNVFFDFTPKPPASIEYE